MLADIAIGSQAVARAIGLLKSPEIRVYVIMPLLINIVFFGLLVWFGFSLFSPFVDKVVSWLPEILDFLEWLIWLVVGGLLAIIVFFTFTPVANIVAAPFNALMSEKIEEKLTGKPPASNISFMQMAIDSVGSQLRKLGYIALWSVALLLVTAIIFFIPLINAITPLLWLLFGAWMLSLDYFDYPMGNHDLTFAEQKRRLQSRRGIALGFGGVVTVMTSIPVVNFFTMPIAVAAATLLWVEQFQKSARADG